MLSVAGEAVADLVGWRVHPLPAGSLGPPSGQRAGKLLVEDLASGYFVRPRSAVTESPSVMLS